MMRQMTDQPGAPVSDTTPKLGSPLPRPFLRLANANLAAQAAEQISLAAVPIVAVLALQAGPREIGWLAAAQSLPFLLLSIPCGLLADSGSRRALMLAGETLRTLAMLGLLLLTALQGVTLPWLAVLGFLGATGTVAFTVAGPALVPRLVPREDLGRANSRLEMARSLAFAGGPALAGALVAWAGASAAFVLASVLAAGAVAWLLRMPHDAAPARAAHQAAQPLAELRDGMHFVWRHALLRPILLCAVIWNISWFVLQAAYVPHAMTRLGLGASGVGVTLALYGVGMVLGSLLAPGLMRRLPFGRVILIGPATSVLAAGLMAASAFWPQPALAALSFFLFGAGPIVWTVSTTTLRQTVTLNERLGRVGALFLTANAGARPLGAALGALVGTLLGDGPAMTACLLIAAGGYVLQLLIIALSAVLPLQDLPPRADTA
jgi:predicted MFS family arabinose efflux permease